MSGYAWALRSSQRPDLRRSFGELAFVGLAAALVGLLLAHDLFFGLLMPALLVAGWLALNPLAAAIALGASLPIVQTVASGHIGLHIAVEDLLLMLLALAAVGAAVIARDGLTFRALRPLAVPALVYCIYVLLLLFAHPGFGALVQTVQRYELIAFPLLIGSYLALKGKHIPLLRSYVIACTALAVAWPFDQFGMQKNPAGQFIANALLLVIAVPRLGRLFQLCVPILVFGLFDTQSRGAIVGTVIGVVILIVVQWARSPSRALVKTLVVGATALVIFQLMPAGTQSFVTSYHSTGESHAAWNIRFRQRFNHDAIKLADANPLLGVGVGSYGTAVSEAGLTATSDPHNVFLLQAVEGGWGFAGAFVVLILGSVAVLVRLRRTELAPAAIAVLAGTVAHGLVDVYWVRGTPVLSWLLVGMVCALAARQRQAPA